MDAYWQSHLGLFCVVHVQKRCCMLGSPAPPPPLADEKARLLLLEKTEAADVGTGHDGLEVEKATPRTARVAPVQAVVIMMMMVVVFDHKHETKWLPV